MDERIVQFRVGVMVLATLLITGILADRFGRTRTLIFTILIYAVFTGMAALSGSWWHLATYRFLTALGIGGEWAAGSVLVSVLRIGRKPDPVPKADGAPKSKTIKINDTDNPL